MVCDGLLQGGKSDDEEGQQRDASFGSNFGKVGRGAGPDAAASKTLSQKRVLRWPFFFGL